MAPNGGNMSAGNGCPRGRIKPGRSTGSPAREAATVAPIPRYNIMRAGRDPERANYGPQQRVRQLVRDRKPDEHTHWRPPPTGSRRRPRPGTAAAGSAIRGARSSVRFRPGIASVQTPASDRGSTGDDGLHHIADRRRTRCRNCDTGPVFSRLRQFLRAPGHAVCMIQLKVAAETSCAQTGQQFRVDGDRAGGRRRADRHRMAAPAGREQRPLMRAH